MQTLTTDNRKQTTFFFNDEATLEQMRDWLEKKLAEEGEEFGDKLGLNEWHSCSTSTAFGDRLQLSGDEDFLELWLGQTELEF